MVNKFIRSLIFALLFIVAGDVIVDYYYKNLDNREYFVIGEMITDKETYKPCDTVTIYTYRTAQYVENAELIRELVAVDTEREYYTTKASLVVEDGTKNIRLLYELPCDLPNGKYYYHGVIEYKIKGVEKHIFFKSNEFDIKGENIEI